MLADVQRIEMIFEAWDETPRGVAVAYRTAIESLHGEAMRRLVRALKNDPAALAAMKEAVADEVVYAVLRRHDIIKPSLNERVEAALESVRPMLASHGGDVELVEIAPPAVQVRFLGACDGCPASALTFHAGVKKAVEAACPEITDIIQVKGAGGGGAVKFVSPFSLDAEGGWLDAGLLSDIPENGVRAIEIDDRKLLLARRNGVVSCFENACAHLGLPFDGAEIEDGALICPHHGFRYDLASGECLTAPEVQLHAHALRVLGRRVEVRLSR